MKIDDSHKPKGASPRIRHPSDPTRDQPQARARTTADKTGDQVHLSPRAREYQKARHVLSTLPDIDTDKVREIKDRLQTGRYHIDADKIAERMLQASFDGDE